MRFILFIVLVVVVLFESAEIATFTPQEKTKYEHEMRTERDFKNQLAYAREKGLEDGREDTLRQIADQLRERGMTEDEIETIVQSIRNAKK